MGVLTREDTQRVEEAIGRAEQRSAGELVVAVVPSCARYGVERLAMAIILSTLLAALGYHYSDHLGLALGYEWLLVQWPVCLGLYYLSGASFLLRLLVHPTALERKVQARAYEIFARKGIYRTRDRTGLLILISQAEHQVVILGDTGIDAVVGQGGWATHVESLVAGIRRGEAAGALVQVIDALGDLIAKHHPRRPDDTNELPNTLVDA